MDGVADGLIQWAAPWHKAYADSKAIESTVAAFHLTGMLVAGGLAISFDRAILRAGRLASEARVALLTELQAVHTPILLALGVVVLSGIGFLLSDLETYLVSPVYWTKMALFGLLLVNALALRTTERRLGTPGGDTPERWRTLRLFSAVSLALWLAIVVASAILVNAA